MKYTEIAYWNKKRRESMILRKRPSGKLPSLGSNPVVLRARKIPYYSRGPGGIGNYTQTELHDEQENENGLT